MTSKIGHRFNSNFSNENAIYYSKSDNINNTKCNRIVDVLMLVAHILQHNSNMGFKYKCGISSCLLDGKTYKYF